MNIISANEERLINGEKTTLRKLFNKDLLEPYRGSTNNEEVNKDAQNYFFAKLVGGSAIWRIGTDFYCELMELQEKKKGSSKNSGKKIEISRPKDKVIYDEKETTLQKLLEQNMLKPYIAEEWIEKLYKYETFWTRTRDDKSTWRISKDFYQEVVENQKQDIEKSNKQRVFGNICKGKKQEELSIQDINYKLDGTSVVEYHDKEQEAFCKATLQELADEHLIFPTVGTKDSYYKLPEDDTKAYFWAVQQYTKEAWRITPEFFKSIGGIEKYQKEFIPLDNDYKALMTLFGVLEAATLAGGTLEYTMLHAWLWFCVVCTGVVGLTVAGSVLGNNEVEKLFQKHSKNNPKNIPGLRELIGGGGIPMLPPPSQEKLALTTEKIEDSVPKDIEYEIAVIQKMLNKHKLLITKHQNSEVGFSLNETNRTYLNEVIETYKNICEPRNSSADAKVKKALDILKDEVTENLRSLQDIEESALDEKIIFLKERFQNKDKEISQEKQYENRE